MRNRFEEKVAKTVGPEFAYEAKRMPFNVMKHYLPDWIDEENKRIIEAKGRFTTEDRQKHRLIKEQYPDWEVTIVFQDARRTIAKRSKTTYADWCDKHGIKWRQA